MSQPNSSIFHPFSKGIVAENKELSSKTIRVTPIEKVAFINGEIASDPKQIEHQGEDASGNKYTSKVITDTIIDAEWLPMGSNRISAPDVRRGEEVMIYRYGNSNKFYWADLGMHANLRKLETVVHAWSGSPNGADDEDLNINNCYYAEVSTHNGTMTMGTSNANGELARYTVQINGKDGKIVIADDQGQSVLIDSIERLLSLVNGDGTEVHLDKKDIRFIAANDFSLQAANSITFKAQTMNAEIAQFINFDTPAFGVTGTFQIGSAADPSSGTRATILGALDIKEGLTVSKGLTVTEGITCGWIDAGQYRNLPS